MAKTSSCALYFTTTATFGDELVYLYQSVSKGLYFVRVLVHIGTMVAQWLRCCATNWKVAGSIPNGVIGIFHWHNPSKCTMALGSTQPLTEMSTRRISWG